jgi:hypothetical protein
MGLLDDCEHFTREFFPIEHFLSSGISIGAAVYPAEDIAVCDVWPPTVASNKDV